MERGKRLFLDVNAIGGVIRIAREFEAGADRLLQDWADWRAGKEREKLGPASAFHAALWLPPHIVQVGADEAVPGHELVIEKGERFVCGQADRPDRQPGKLDGDRVQIDSEETSLGDIAPHAGALGG